MTRPPSLLLPGRILIVDDNESFRQLYTEKLSGEGYTVEAVSDMKAAQAKLDASAWDLVLVDRMLQGGSADTGTDLIGEIKRRAPTTKVMLITAFPDPDSVERAFNAGADDYLEKNEIFDAILRSKVRTVLDGARERWLAALANGERERAIKQLWEEAKTERNRNKKGKALEDLFALLLKSIPGFERTITNRRADDEEIDTFTPNDSPDRFWQNERSQYLFGECKNWSGPTDPKEITHFIGKIERSYGRCRLGFFVAINGFTQGAQQHARDERKGDVLVLLLRGADVERLVMAKDRNAILKEFHQRAITG
jgi:DNA-binding response OmpR family regulator